MTRQLTSLGNPRYLRARTTLMGAVMVIALAVGLCSISPARAQVDEITLVNSGSVSKVTMPPGTTRTVRTDRTFSDLVVGDPEIADIVPLSSQVLYIQGKSTGLTNISIYNEQKALLGVIEVRVQLNFDEVARAVRAVAPTAQVRVSNVGNRIRLFGNVNSATDLTKVLEVAQQFSEAPVINALSVRGPQQVALEIRVLEASRSIGRDLGVNWVGRSSDGNVSTSGARVQTGVDETTGGLIAILGSGASVAQQGALPFGTLVAKVLETAGLRIDTIIDALEGKGLVRRLAQPNLTTISGEAARFHVGGEVPIQTATSSAGGVATSTDYRPFGVRLEFVPTVLDESRINLRVMTEVSDIDGSINVNGNPGFRSRRAEAVIELRDGQSFSMAGLLDNIDQRDINQIPWLGQVPVLGVLFRSTSFQKRETDLVIVATPRLVRPANPSENLASPLDRTRPANDAEMFALGLLEVNKDMLRTYREGKGLIGPYGHIVDLELEAGYVYKKN
ncbi:type II and III secretion system protein family protein [Labrenzia aggregata]|uniref:Type II and III secretion system protein family protein n=2 Tax=Roseibium aggregatum TaxID=187304 RepID=A0A939EJ98_9HYPH|nr:type II and III secretion system protein family protein [Roseibium aggregatum]MBN9673746.1 type II and III secretion system protein family protein [Roseibium aggregatum]